MASNDRACAVTGSIHTPTMSPHLPVTPTEIADAAIGAAEAGGGIGAHPEDVMQMRRTAEGLFGRSNYHWSVLGAGRNQMPIAAMAAVMGGNVRVGLEDSLWLGPGKLAESNAAQVRQVRQLLEGLGLVVATADEARKILALKGADKVGF
jgi:uncharacterized protein (DUF849 family)